MLVWVFVLLFIPLSRGGSYYDWQLEYDGAGSNTLALFKFNTAGIYTNGATALSPVLPDQTGTKWDAGFSYATATCEFVLDGRFGGGLHAPGGTSIDAKCEAQNSADLFPQSADPSLTVECWVRFFDTASLQHLVSKGNAWSSVGGYDLWYENGKLKMAVSDGNGANQASGDWTPVSNRWHHVALTWNALSDTASIYADGALVGSTVHNGVSISDHSGRKLAIGTRSVTTYNALNGVIDEVRISDVAYAFSNDKYYAWKEPLNGLEAGTVALYTFDSVSIYSDATKTYSQCNPDQSASDWDAYYSTASATCSFGAGGRFDWGLHEPGGTSVDAKCETYNGSNVFPAGADPSLSIECWINFSSTAGRQHLISKGNAWSSVGGYDLWFDNNVLKVSISDGAAAKQLSGNWTPVASQWYHLAATWDAATDTAKLFVDGQEIAFTVFQGLQIVDHAARKLTIGNRCVSGYSALNGVIDEVRISNVARKYGAPTQPPVFAAGHPRLFFSAADYADLEARRHSTHSDEWDQLIAKCENLKGTSPTTDPRSATDLFLYEENLVSLAFAQMIDSSLPYYDTATNWFWTILNWTEWGAGNWSWPDYGPHGNLETGEVLKGLAAWYDLMYHTLSQAERDDAEQKLSDYADRFRNSYPRFEATNGEQVGNHCWNALVSLAAVKYGVDGIASVRMTDWTDLLNGHYNSITNLMNNEMSDGATGEGATYWMYGTEKILSWFEMRRVAGESAFSNVSWFTNTGVYGVFSTLPGGDDNFGGVNKFSDANGNFWGNPYNDLPLLAKNTGDGAAQWLTTQLDHKGATKKDVFRYMFYDASVAAVVPATGLNNWWFFDDYGLFLWRTDWDNDASYFALRSGVHSHGHDKCDDGQFMIHRAGIPYIANLGYAVPRRTQDGNILLVDGTGQLSDGDDWGTVFNVAWPSNQQMWGQTKLVLANEWSSQPGDFFNVLIDPTPLYTDTQLTAWNREVVGLGEDLYLLRDTVDASAGKTFDLLLHAYVTAKGTGDSYDQDTYKTSNPWTDLGGGKWSIDARNETPEPPNMLVQDLSKNTWSSQINDTFYDDKYTGNTRRGSKLKRSITGTSASSLVSFGFDDLMSGWTQAKWGDAAAEGVHVTASGSAVIDVLWPVNGSSCSNSDNWTVTGKMAGRRYAQVTDDPDACYFAREATSVVDNGLSLVSATTPVSLHAKIEQTIGGGVSNVVTISAAAASTVTLYAPKQPLSVKLDGTAISFTWTANQLTVTVPASASSKLELSGQAPANQPPVFTSNPVVETNATEDTAYSSSIADNATDANGDPLTFSSISGPAWLSVAANGALSGIPSNTDVGLNSWLVQVSDGIAAPVQETLEITVNNVNDAPVFTADPFSATNGTQDAAYSDSISGSATDMDAGDTLTYSKVSGPAWLSVAADGTLSGTPSNNDVGTNVFFVKAEDVALASDTATLNIIVANINDAPVFTSDPFNASNGMQDAAYSDSISGSATDMDAGDTLTYSKVSGPAWLSVASNGALTGTPGASDVGTNVFSVKVEDAALASGTATLNIFIGAVIGGVVLDEDFAGETISTLSGQGWTFSGQAGAEEVLQTSNSDLLGANKDYLDIGGSYSNQPFAQKSFGTVGKGELKAVAFTSSSYSAARVKLLDASNNVLFAFRMQKPTSIYIDDTVTGFSVDPMTNSATHDLLSSGNSITELTVTWDGSAVSWQAVNKNADTGAVIYDTGVQNDTFGTAGTPSQIRLDTGTYNHNARRFGTTDILVTDTGGNDAPSFTADPFSKANATENSAYSGSILGDASDPESDPMSFSKVSGPAWLNIATNGALSGTPGAGDTGTNTFSVKVEAIGGSDTATLNIVVDAAPPSWIELTNDGFESGWGNWIDGGADARLSSTFAVGTQCFALQDNTSSSVAILSSSLDLASYTELKIEFSYVVQSFENAEDFWLRYSSDGGSSWTTVKAFVNDVDFVDDGTRYSPSITIDSGSYTFNNNVKIQFRCDASGNSDDVYIDNVRIFGR
jgi:hypothetical protein